MAEVGPGLRTPLGRLCLALRVRGGLAGGLKLLEGSAPVGKAFGDVHSALAALVLHQVPDAAAAGDGQQSPLAVAASAPEVLQQGSRVDAPQPPRPAGKADPDRTLLPE